MALFNLVTTVLIGSIVLVANIKKTAPSWFVFWCIYLSLLMQEIATYVDH